MPWQAPDYQADVLDTLGLTSTDPLATQVPKLFAQYDTLPTEQAAVFVRRRLIDRLVGRLLSMPVATEADVNAIRAKRETLATLRRETDAEIQRIYNSRPPVAGQMTTTAPQNPPVGWPNANAPRYRGSPYPGETEAW